MQLSRRSFVFQVLVLLSLSRATGAAETVTVTPAEDEKVVLHNPDMGWVLYENYPVDREPNGSNTMIAMPDDSFDGVDEVAVMFSWFDVEKTEGKYDFIDVDRAYDHWKKRGKRIQLRMSTETLLWWDTANPPRGKGPPDYVVARMSDERKQRREGGGLPPYTVLDARDPIYLQRLEKFLAAVADHYNGDRAVTLIDLRGFGVWGEWHTGFKYPSVEERREALKGVIDRYSAAFPNNWVALCYSYDPDSPKELWAGPYDKLDPAFTTHYDEFLRYSAFDHALTKPNVSFRRDGCGGAVRSNERKLCGQAFDSLDNGPFFCEFVDGFGDSKRGRLGWVDWKIEDALSLHPNYINLLGWVGGDAKNFITERRDLFEHGQRNMGYRLVPTKLSYPRSVTSGSSFELSGEWVNRAVGRAMVDFKLKLTLVDGAGKSAATADAKGFGTDKWVKGKTYPVRSTLAFADVKPGQYELCVSLVDPRDGKAIGLPLKGDVGERAYRVGAIGVAE
jgi:hypothetical protein